MRRLVAIVAAAALVASLAGSSLAAAPSYRVNRMVGNFDILTWDGTLAGHVVVNYSEPTYEQYVPGRLDVTWVPGALFPYEQPPYGADESHAVLVAGWFGPGTPSTFIETGTMGSMCDYGAPWNAICHDFEVVIQENPFGDGRNLIAFGVPDWEGNPAAWYVVGRGSFALTYTGPTESQPEPR